MPSYVKLFLHKWLHYEYWPWWFFYAPMLPFWLFEAIRARSLTYFTAVNPSIEAGGFYGERKTTILANIPTEYLPKAIFIDLSCSIHNILEVLQSRQIDFPIIAKPNIGERGTAVEKITDITTLSNYHTTATADYLLQEFIDYPIEFGILYSRLPHQSAGLVSSITQKEFLTVVGDGQATLSQLINSTPRGAYQYQRLKHKWQHQLVQVLPMGQKLLLEPIGNHCRGTKFLNANHLINSHIHKIFDKISTPYEGFYYGRFDLKVKSIEDFYEGRNIKIMELNGVSSDPGHIYDPNYSLWKAYRDLIWHWHRAATISILNQKNGHKPVSISILWKTVAQHFFK